MKILGIVAEYNPFHNGHSYHLEQSKKTTGCEYTVAVMSGNYMQRGEIALFDKWSKAKCAVLGGVDLVLELPFCFAVQSAEFFADRAVHILDETGCVDFLSFGSESGDAQKLFKVANSIVEESGEYTNRMQELLGSGISYPAARGGAIGKLLGGAYEDILLEPNNTLGIEYLKSLIKRKSTITPVTIKRHMVGHNDQTAKNRFASASYIRSLVCKNVSNQAAEYLPDSSYDILKEAAEKGRLINMAAFDAFLMASLMTKTKEEFYNICDVNEGLENRLYEAVKSCNTMEEVLAFAKTKRYTMTRLKRILLNSAFGVTKQVQGFAPEYAKVLAFNDKGREILKVMDETARIKIITKPKDIDKIQTPSSKFVFEKERMAQDVFACCSGQKQEKGQEYKTSPVYVKSQ